MNSIFINKLVSTFNYARAYRVSFNWLNESSAPSVGQHRGSNVMVAYEVHILEVGFEHHFRNNETEGLFSG